MTTTPLPTPVDATKGTVARSVVLIVLFAMATVLTGYAAFAGLIGGWGFGLVLVLGGVVVLATLGLVKGGAAGAVSCPECGTRRKIKGVRMHRYHRCRSCGTWSAGTDSMGVIADDHVANGPLFTAIVTSDAIGWPSGCPVCGGPTTRDVEVQGTTALGPAVAAVSPVSIQTVARVRIPHCDAHRDGVDIEVVSRGLEVRFRSMPYWRRFVEANDATVPKTGEVWPPECDGA